MARFRGLVVILVGLAILAGATYGAWVWFRQYKNPPAAPPVANANVLLPGTEVVFEAPIEAVKTVDVPAEVSGVLEEFPVQPGDEVAEGQVLGRIKNDGLEDQQREAAAEMERVQNKISSLESSLIAARLEASRAEAELTRARTDFAAAEKRFQRESLLHREGATPRKKFEAATAAYEQLKLEIETHDSTSRRVRERIDQLNKEIELNRKTLEEKESVLETTKNESAAAELRAPVNGVIVAINRKAGDPVEKGTPDVIRIGVELNLLQITVEPEPPVLARLKPGLTAQVELPDVPGLIPANLRQIEGTKVTFEFGSPSTLIRPATAAKIRVKLP